VVVRQSVVRRLVRVWFVLIVMSLVVVCLFDSIGCLLEVVTEEKNSGNENKLSTFFWERIDGFKSARSYQTQDNDCISWTDIARFLWCFPDPLVVLTICCSSDSRSTPCPPSCKGIASHVRYECTHFIIRYHLHCSTAARPAHRLTTPFSNLSPLTSFSKRCS
jgi:hypothetical protein